MSNIVPLDLVKSVVDPIHGLIRMSQEEHEVMQSPVFQRLRGIKQNGLLHLIFPSATHTRFEHSLGVMFVADSVLQALYFNSEVERKKGLARGSLPDPDSPEKGLAIDFAQVKAKTLKHIFRITRLAALVHDMGHGPLSHTFDKFAPARARVEALLEEPEFKLLGPLRGAMFPGKTPDEKKGPIEHEAMSCLMFCWHWSRGGDRDDWVPLAVATAVLGSKRVPQAPEGVPPRLREWMPLIQDIVASAPVDADRLDYVERDSRSCGVNYGLYDRNRLLKSALCYRSDAGGFRLGWKLSGLRAIEVFMHARFQLYAQIYYHKTNGALGEMIEDIRRQLLEHGRHELFSADTVHELINGYCTQNDDSFLRMLCGEGEPLRGLVPVNSLAKRIATRTNLYRRLHETTAEMSAERMQAALRAVHRDKNLPIEAVMSPLGATKDLHKGAVLLRRDRDGRYAAPAPVATKDQDGGEDWRDASPLIRTLHEEEKRIERLYWKGTDEAEYRALRGLVQTISGAERRR